MGLFNELYTNGEASDGLIVQESAVIASLSVDLWVSSGGDIVNVTVPVGAPSLNP